MLDYFRPVFSFLYVLTCVLLISAVILQHYRSDFSSGSTQSYFGGSGSKDFLYRATKFLIAAFFTLAFLQTALSYRQIAKEHDSEEATIAQILKHKVQEESKNQS